MFRVIISLFLFSALINDVRSQHLEADTLDVLIACYRVEELDKKMFSNNRHPAESIFILCWDEQDAPQPNVSFDPHEQEHNGVHFYFYKRASLIGFNIDHWIVIDKFKMRQNTAKVIFRTVGSNNNWAWQNDATDQTFTVTLKKHKGKWKIVRKDILNNPNKAER